MAATALTITIVGRKLPGRVCGPHHAVRVGLQVGKQHEGVVDAGAARATWIAEAAAHDVDGGIDVRGPAVHGRRGERFLYLVWLETPPGKPETMFRRAKLQLDGVPADVLRRARASGRLNAALELTAADGLPVCASVRPPKIAWTAG
jgi:hypothetical protein